VTGTAPRLAVRLRCLTVGALLVATAAHGDGGLLRASEAAGPLVVSIFTAPTPLRVGPADVSIMVQATDDHSAVLDAEVQVVLHGPGVERTATATRAAATNKLLYAALLDLPAPGHWTLAAEVRAGARRAHVSCEVDVAPALPPALAFWPYLALPGLAIALFALHQWLQRSHRPVALP
jgi:hypothetical protein